MEFLKLIIGLILLIKFADFFVDASVDIAKSFNISEIIIGATIVAIGTTLPETMVSSVSAIKGHGDIAYGNALGSIICNTSFIAAITLVFRPGEVKRSAIKIPVIFFFTSFALYVIYAVVFNGFSRICGISLFAIFIIYIVVIVKKSIQEKDSQSSPLPSDDSQSLPQQDDAPHNSVLRSLVILIISAVVIAFSSNLLVDNGIIIARRFHVPESVIGITLIALGTSLPELTTAITSLLKGHSNLSIGNIIGANFYNIVNVTGIAAILNPFMIPEGRKIYGINSSFVIDIPTALISMLILCIPTLIYKKTSRWQGILLIIIYIGFIFYQIKSI